MNNILNREQIESLIDRYFNAETTPEEEKLLKQALAHDDDPRYDEVRAVMGYEVMKAHHAASVKHVDRARRTINIAAMAATIIAITMGIIANGNGNAINSDECFAYVNGERINDESHVMSIMNHDLANLRTASDEVKDNVESQLDDMRNAMNEYN